jgi:DNA-binding NarL/FixJ family response regulator
MKDRLLHRVAGLSEDKQSESPLTSLTDRELEVFQLLGRGLSTREIASSLFLSIKTIETHRDHIKTKLSLESGRELVRFATSWYMEQA